MKTKQYFDNARSGKVNKRLSWCRRCRAPVFECDGEWFHEAASLDKRHKARPIKGCYYGHVTVRGLLTAGNVH